MKLSEMFPSKYLKAADLDGDTVGTISDIRTESLQNAGQPPEDKPVVYFTEISKGLVMNKTNGETIGGIYGDDLDDWIGKPVTLYVDENVRFQGKTMPAIRIRSKPPSTGVQSKAPTPRRPRNQAVVSADDMGLDKPDQISDESIPF